MVDPVGVLRAMRAMRADGATVLVADGRVADEFTVDVDDGSGSSGAGARCIACPAR